MSYLETGLRILAKMHGTGEPSWALADSSMPLGGASKSLACCAALQLDKFATDGHVLVAISHPLGGRVLFVSEPKKLAMLRSVWATACANTEATTINRAEGATVEEIEHGC